METQDFQFSNDKIIEEYDCYTGGTILAKAIQDGKFLSNQEKNVWFGLNFWEGFIDYCEEEKIKFKEELIKKFPGPRGDYRAADLDERLKRLFKKD